MPVLSGKLGVLLPRLQKIEKFLTNGVLQPEVLPEAFCRTRFSRAI
jgi:hypothetical protein